MTERHERIVRRDIRQERIDLVLRVAPGLPKPETFHSDGATWLRPCCRSTVEQRAWLHAAGFEWKGGYWVIPALEQD